MKVIFFLFLISIFINPLYCGIYSTLSEELAALILVAANDGIKLDICSLTRNPKNNKIIIDYIDNGKKQYQNINIDNAHFQLVKQFIEECKKNSKCTDLYTHSIEVNIHFVEKNDGNNIKYYPFLSSDDYNANGYNGKLLLPFIFTKNTDGTFSNDITLKKNSLAIECKDPKVTFVNDINQSYYKNYDNIDSYIEDRGIFIIPASGISIQNELYMKDEKGKEILYTFTAYPDKYVYYNNDETKTINYDRILTNFKGEENFDIKMTAATNYKTTENEKINIGIIDYKRNIYLIENIANEYTDNTKYISIDSEIRNYIEERIRVNSLSNKQLLKLKYIIGINLCLKLFPMKSDNSFQGFSTKGGHAYEISKKIKTYNLIQSEINNRINKALENNDDTTLEELGDVIVDSCSLSKLRKRSTMCKINKMSLSTNYDINTSTIDTLKIFRNKNLDSNILISNNGEPQDILNLNEIYKNSETIDNMWIKLTKLYIDNIDIFNKDESQDFIINFNEVINGYKQRISNSEYINNDLIKNINKENINNMENEFNNAYNIHKNYFGLIYDDNYDEIIYIRNFDKDSQSKIYKDTYRELIYKLSITKKIYYTVFYYI